jgi:hypothetical protein
MSSAAVWDRFFWSLMLSIFVVFAWLKFLDRLMPLRPTGVFLAGGAGVAYLAIGIIHLRQKDRKAKTMEDEEQADA